MDEKCESAKVRKCESARCLTTQRRDGAALLSARWRDTAAERRLHSTGGLHRTHSKGGMGCDTTGDTDTTTRWPAPAARHGATTTDCAATARRRPRGGPS